MAITSLDFGSVNAGQSKDLKFTVSNSGNATLTVKSASSGNAVFSATAPAFPFTVKAGQQQDVRTVHFAPAAGGAVSASLTVASVTIPHAAR